MKNRITAIILCAALLLASAVTLTGCGTVLPAGAADLMEGIEAHDLGDPGRVGDADGAAAADFAVRLFKECAKGENVLVSPLSVLAALSMTANGAKGETLSEMEAVLGMKCDALNAFFRSYMNALKPTDKCKLSLADSIWFRDGRFTVNQEFLQTNADYYDADAYRVPFNGETLKQINAWVKQNTDGMIPKILDELSGSTVMVLINALAFDAEWQTVYRSDQIREGTFTLEDGTERKADLMYSQEGAYLEDELATGFIKYYAGNRFAFVAMLPNEGVTVDEYIASLDGESLMKTLYGAKTLTVHAAIPKFQTEYSSELKGVLSGMGMKKAFTADADFSGIGTSENGAISIDSVIHKTFISVDEKGTKAGAATAVIMKEAAAVYEETKTVILDRPFVYMLVDTETYLPFFIGAMTDVG